MLEVNTDVVIDAIGLTCPMPIVRTKKEMKDMKHGEVAEIQATDRGSIADLQAWAKSNGHEYIGFMEEGEVMKHYIRKANEEIEESNHPHVIENEELEQKRHEPITILDVREPAEYAFRHIPEAKLMPLGEIDSRVDELDTQKPIYVICRTGSRSDLAAQKLTEHGLKHVWNVRPGMREWKYQTNGVKKGEK